MRRSVWMVAALPLVAWQIQGCTTREARAQSVGRAAAKHDAREIDLTIYREDFAMVHERRPLSLRAGAQRLHLPEVSRQLDPHSVMLDWAGEGDGLPSLVSNRYDLGVKDSSSLLNRYLGDEVELVRYGENGRVADRERGTLMVSGHGQTVLQTGDKLIVNPEGTIVAPARPDVVTIPQLSVQLDSPKAQHATLDVSYLTRGLSWSADYVATIHPTDEAIELQCWATVLNKTGTTFPMSRVTLMAGEPSRAARDSRLREEDLAASAGMPLRDPTLPALGAGEIVRGAFRYKPEAVGEMQAYKVERPADVVDGQMNRLLVFARERVPVKREYRATLPPLGAYGWGWAPDQGRGSVQMSFRFLNDPKSGLGLPLPAGALRVYGEGKGGSKHYLGAATVLNTPKDMKVDVTLANAFDLYTQRRVVNSRKVAKRTVRKTVEIDLHNEKEADATVRVVQPIYARWKVVAESLPHRKTDASTAAWDVSVRAGGKTTLRFQVDLQG